MGDRANFVFRQPNGHSIVLYGHWGGHEMMHNLAVAIEKAEPRWSDESYATRIMVSQLVNDEWNQELSWGLLVDEIGDNEHSIPVVDFSNNTVSLYTEGEVLSLFSNVEATPKFTMNFPQFINKFKKS